MHIGTEEASQSLILTCPNCTIDMRVKLPMPLAQAGVDFHCFNCRANIQLKGDWDYSYDGD